MIFDFLRTICCDWIGACYGISSLGYVGHFALNHGRLVDGSGVCD
jgi:hypothetical protein